MSCAFCFLALLCSHYLESKAAAVVVEDPRFPRYACGTVSLLALAYMYGNAVFGWSSAGGMSGVESELGAVTNFVLRQGAGGGIKATKVS